MVCFMYLNYQKYSTMNVYDHQWEVLNKANFNKYAKTLKSLYDLKFILNKNLTQSQKE